jgi:hypothetical protein
MRHRNNPHVSVKKVVGGVVGNLIMGIIHYGNEQRT